MLIDLGRSDEKLGSRLLRASAEAPGESLHEALPRQRWRQGVMAIRAAPWPTLMGCPAWLLAVLTGVTVPAE
jgi:hypothetical protein